MCAAVESQNEAARQSAEVQKLDSKQILQFLQTGKRENCRETLCSFFDQIGYSALESMMLRLYITIDLYVTAHSFTKSLGISGEAFQDRFGSVDDIAQKLNPITSAIDYFTDMFEQCIDWRITSSKKDESALMEKAQEYIKAHFAQDDISLKRVAAAVGLSPTYFSSLFKKAVGTNFVDYLTRVRIERAKELLCCTSLQVSEIADQVGFRDYRYFSQIFKKYTGYTPREFQEHSNH